jgi:hypothetical protein
MSTSPRLSLQQLGWPGMVGGILLVSGLLFDQWVLTPMTERLAATEAEIVRPDRPRSDAAPAFVSRDFSLDKFYDHFTLREGITDELARMYSIAEDSGLALNQANYKLITLPSSRLQQYQITLQTTGEYASIRNFSLQVLNTMPNTTLDSIRFERQSTTSSLLSSEMVISLYWFKAGVQTP